MDSGPSGARAGLAGGHPPGHGTAVAAPVVVAPAARRWASVGFQELAAHPERGLERYRLEAIQPVRGRRPAEWKAGMAVTRREHVAIEAPEAGPGAWTGLVDVALSTAPDQAAQLQGSWQHNPFRVTLLIACKHVPRFWALSPNERAFDHCGLPDRAGVTRSPILRKVVRHLQRVAPAETAVGEWDTLAQFEMLPEHVAHLREHLAERRELAALSNLVEREVELWLVKSLDGDPNSGPNSNAG
jgi:hypothetical protein